MSDEATDNTDVVEQVENVVSTATTEQESTPELVNDDAAASTENAEEDKPSRAQQRIQQLVGDKKAAMEYGNFWKDKFEQSNTPAPVVEAPKPLVVPKLEDYDHDTERWSNAMIDYSGAMITQTVSTQVNQVIDANQKQTAQAEQDANWSDNVSKFKEANPDVDFDSVAFATKDIYSVIKGHNKGPEIAIYLGQNPAEAQRIGSLPPSQQAFALGQVPLSPNKPVAKLKTTQAPEPPNPVGGVQPDTSIANESIEDYMKRMNASDRERRAGRR